MFYNDKKPSDNQYGLWKDKEKKPLFDFGNNEKTREKREKKKKEILDHIIIIED